MVVSLGDEIGFFASPDLVRWAPLSRFGAGQGLHSAVWECPDLFPLRVDGDPDRVRWVLTVSVGAGDATGGSTAQYFVGDFDGTTFVCDPSVSPETVEQTDLGQDFYAAQSYENAPAGCCTWIGWMGNWRYPYSAPTHPWTNAMSVPRDLGLRTVDGRVRLVQAPVQDLESLRGTATRVGPRAIERDTVLPMTGSNVEIEAEIETRDAARVGLRRAREPGRGRAPRGVRRDRVHQRRRRAVLHGSHRGARSGAGRGRCARRTSRCDVAQPYRPVDGLVRVQVLVDESSVEVFVDDGALTGTMLAILRAAVRGCLWQPKVAVPGCAA